MDGRIIVRMFEAIDDAMNSCGKIHSKNVNIKDNKDLFLREIKFCKCFSLNLLEMASTNVESLLKVFRKIVMVTPLMHGWKLPSLELKCLKWERKHFDS